MSSTDGLEKSPPLVDVTLFLRGDLLDPAQVNSMLGIDGLKTRIRGEKWRTSTNFEVIAKTGLWTLTAQSKSEFLSDHISWFRQKLSSAQCSPSAVPGVCEVEMSIFVALGSNGRGGGDFESKLAVDDLVWLGNIGATLSLSFVYVAE